MALRPIQVMMVDDPADEYHCISKLQEKLCKNRKPPFRDPESLGYFQEVLDTDLDEDWYSIPSPEGYWESRGPRLAFCDLHPDHIAALLLIQNSRAGIYTPFEPLKFLTENAWSYLASLPFDILLTMPRDTEIDLLPHMTDLQINNYRFHGKEIMLTVTKRAFQNRFEKGDFLKEWDEKSFLWDGAGYGLCIGKDGNYYMSPLDFSRANRYFWMNDIFDTIHYLESRHSMREIQFLPETPAVYARSDYEKLAQNNPFELERHQSVSYVLQKPSLMDEEMGDIENAVEDKTEAAADASSAFPIINHLFRPVDVGSRKLPILMVDHMADDSFLMQSELTWKYPEFDEILDQVCDMRNDPSSARKERYMIVVDVNEVMQSKENFEETVYGFLLRPDCLEVFGKDEALIRFEAVLREAAASGHYKYVESEEL